MINKKYFTGFCLIVIGILLFVIANGIGDVSLKFFSGMPVGYGIYCLEKAIKMERKK